MFTYLLSFIFARLFCKTIFYRCRNESLVENHAEKIPLLIKLKPSKFHEAKNKS